MPEYYRTISNIKKLLTKKQFTIAVAVVFLFVFTTSGWFLFTSTVPGGNEKEHLVQIKPGMTFNQIVNYLLENNVISSELSFEISAHILGVQDELKAGKYRITGGESNYSLLQKLSEGKVAIEWVTIPEGKTARQIAGILVDRVEVDSARFMALVNDSAFSRQLGIAADRLEGFLFPETYGLHWGMNARQIIKLMVSHYQERFDSTLQARSRELGLTELEVVTLASIIEGEAVVDSERTTISAVYHNRLDRGMLLQADPTIQYIIDDGPRRLLNRDLEIDSPYNTYKNPGLPPGPINNPGLASIKAALYPADEKYLYFVARGDGSHIFSKTLNEHLRAKAEFDKYRKEILRTKTNSGNDG